MMSYAHNRSAPYFIFFYRSKTYFGWGYYIFFGSLCCSVRSLEPISFIIIIKMRSPSFFVAPSWPGKKKKRDGLRQMGMDKIIAIDLVLCVIHNFCVGVRENGGRYLWQISCFKLLLQQSLYEGIHKKLTGATTSQKHSNQEEEEEEEDARCHHH